MNIKKGEIQFLYFLFERSFTKDEYQVINVENF
jgi:hypothetical protein